MLADGGNKPLRELPADADVVILTMPMGGWLMRVAVVARAPSARTSAQRWRAGADST